MGSVKELHRSSQDNFKDKCSRSNSLEITVLYFFQQTCKKETVIQTMRIENKPLFVECKLCYKQFKTITHSHCAYHGITQKDYKKQFDLCAGEITSRGTSLKKSFNAHRNIEKHILIPITSENRNKIYVRLPKERRKAIGIRASKKGHTARMSFWNSMSEGEKSDRARKALLKGWNNGDIKSKEKRINRAVKDLKNWRKNNPEAARKLCRMNGITAILKRRGIAIPDNPDLNPLCPTCGNDKLIQIKKKGRCYPNRGRQRTLLCEKCGYKWRSKSTGLLRF